MIFKPLALLCMLLATLALHGQRISLSKYGTEKDSRIFTRALSDIKSRYSTKKQHVLLVIPAGSYELTEPIVLNKYISLEGEFSGSTILRVQSTQHEAIILEDNKNEADIYNNYNSISNLTLAGPEFGKNPFAWKDLKRNNPRSVGLKILGLRNRVQNCVIEGFLWSGIGISSSYYNYIQNNFIQNNRVGIIIENTSTSAYINNNEIRTNGLGILVQNNSYANFINNNMIENNIAHLLEAAQGQTDPSALTLGSGVLIRNAMNNFVQNNYFEQHLNNVSLINAAGNLVTANFFAVNDLNGEKQNILKLAGKSVNNSFTQNQTMGANEKIDSNRTVISDGFDYSTNILDFGKEKNTELKNQLKNKNPKWAPNIPE